MRDPSCTQEQEQAPKTPSTRIEVQDGGGFTAIVLVLSVLVVVFWAGGIFALSFMCGG